MSFQFERFGEFYEDDITIKIFLHEYGNDFTFAKHKVNDFFELEKGQIIKYYMKKTVVRSLPAKDRPCSRKRYYGLRSCIENSVSISSLQTIITKSSVTARHGDTSRNHNKTKTVTARHGMARWRFTSIL